MKIAVLSDIHGNADALTAVLVEAKKNNVQELLILGDCVGYYYHTDLVFEKLFEWECHWVFGNHEKLLLSFIDGDNTVKDKLRKKYGRGFDYCVEKLPEDILRFIRELKATKKIDFENVSILMCHGSPWNYDEYIYPDASIDKLMQCDQRGVDFVLMGHTHYPFVFKGTHSIIANVGSVGQSRVLGGVANWALIDTNNKSYVTKHTLYNTEKLKKEVKLINPELSYLWEILDRK